MAASGRTRAPGADGTDRLDHPLAADALNQVIDAGGEGFHIPWIDCGKGGLR